MVRPDPIPSSASLRWRLFRERWLPLVAYAGALVVVAVLWRQRLGTHPVGGPGGAAPSLVAAHPAGPGPVPVPCPALPSDPP